MNRFFLGFYILFLFFASNLSYGQDVEFNIKDSSGNNDVLINCNYILDSNGCLQLKADYTPIYATNRYTVNATAYVPLIPYNDGTALEANTDDQYFTELSIPFTFCFYGNTFNSLVVSSNGLISFNTSLLNAASLPNIRATNPSSLLDGNSIFGVYHDMVFEAMNNSDVYFSTIGTAPNRKFIINFYRGRISGCNEQNSTSQIVLHETSNIIDIFIDQKPEQCSTARFNTSLIGIINNTGSTGISPSNRNTGVWAANKEAWRFTPSGTEMKPSIKWLDDNGEIIGTNETLQVCPSQETNIYAEIEYNACRSEFVKLKDDLSIKFDSELPQANNYLEPFCGTVSKNLNDYRIFLTTQNLNAFNFRYFYSQSGANTNNSTNELPSPNVTISSEIDYYVRIENKNNTNCFKVVKISFVHLSKSLLTNTVTICDSNNDGIERNYLLSRLNTQLFGAGITGITYYASQNDANTRTTITRLDLTLATKLWVRVDNMDCSQVYGPISINFSSAPIVTTPIAPFIKSICDNNADGVEDFIWESELKTLVTTDLSAIVRFYDTEARAISGGTANVLTTITEGNYSIFARVTKSNCFSIVEIPMRIAFTKAPEVKNKIVTFCFDGTQDISVNLMDYVGDVLITPIGNVSSIKFFRSLSQANEGTNNINPNQIITENGSAIRKNFYVRFESGLCYSVGRITVELIHPAPIKDTFDLCRLDLNQNASLTLATLTPDIIGSQAFRVEYFSDITATSPINQINLTTTTTTVYAKLSFTRGSITCSEIHPIKINLVDTPQVVTSISKTINEFCDNNNDNRETIDLTRFETEINNESLSNLSYEYYRNYNANTNTFSGAITNPTAFAITGSYRVFVKVFYNDSSCFTVTTIDITLNFKPSIVLEKNVRLLQCDPEYDYNETFDLKNAITRLFKIENNPDYLLEDLDISFYLTQNLANAGNLTDRIPNDELYVTTATRTVWARFESKTSGCYSTASVKLDIVFPVKAKSYIVPACFNHLENVYVINLLTYKDFFVDGPSDPDYIFTFHTNQSDAVLGQNEILNPEYYKVNPLPNRLFVRIEVTKDCFDVVPFTFESGNTLILDATSVSSLVKCDENNDGEESFDLTIKQAEILNDTKAIFEYYKTLEDLHAGVNKITTPTNYLYNESIDPDYVFVKISNKLYSCPNYVKIDLVLLKSPIVPNQTIEICPDATTTIIPDYQDLSIVDYKWINDKNEVISTSPNLENVKEAGIYTLELTSTNGCITQSFFIVQHLDVPTIVSIYPTNSNTFTITATGNGSTIEYSIDGVTWQNNNVFRNISSGEVTFYVRYNPDGCIVSRTIFSNIFVSNAITPNGDGINDAWEINGLDLFEGEIVDVQIFDRYGNTIFKQASATNILWDGKVNGTPVPSDSYWYQIKYPNRETSYGWILVKSK